MTLYRDEGVVLRTRSLSEADRIVTMLTRRNGRVRAVAKGVRRTRSKFGARLEPFTRVDLQCYTSPRPGSGLDIITEAVTLDPFGMTLAQDFARWAAAMTVAEAAERLTGEEREPSLRLYLLVVGALRALVEAGPLRPVEQVVDSFLLRAMETAGYGPALDRCASCDAPGPHPTLSVAAGGVTCLPCRPPGSVRPSAPALVLLGGLARGDWPVVTASTPAARREAAGLVAALWTWHDERGLRSLAMVERA